MIPTVAPDSTAKETTLAVLLGLWASAVALAPNVGFQLALMVPLVAMALFFWVILRPFDWVVAFFLAILLLPPLPLPFGNSGVHIAPLLVGLGGLTSLVWIDKWRTWAHPVTTAFLFFVAVLLESLAFAVVYSGWQVAAGSLARVFLFAISVFVFLYAYAGPRPATWSDPRVCRLLFGIAIAGAVFACADFYFQFPAPAGYGDQFVWLPDAVLRRAQGLFYEASTLGNFCAFFLTMAAVSLFRGRKQAPCSRPVLLLGGLILAAALIFSYSRASVLNVVVAIGVLTCIRFKRFRRSVLVIFGSLIFAGIGIHLAFPVFSSKYWDRMLVSFSLFEQTNQVLSGRLDHWRTVADFLSQNPWHLIFGIGYKTLPYSEFIGSTVVADNTYLGLLAETGILGLGAFIAVNAAIIRTGWRALRSSRPEASFLGEWIFCFWCGQMIQMLSGDLITYWRVLPVYFWVLGAAARQTKEGS